jgi:hypothetical protein
MWYVFNKDKKAIATCDSQPNMDDLNERGDFAIESDSNIALNNIILKGDTVSERLC